MNNNCMKHKCKYYRPWLERKHKANYSFQSQVRKSEVTRVRKSGVRKVGSPNGDTRLRDVLSISRVNSNPFKIL